jgi:hypothetical protein
MVLTTTVVQHLPHIFSSRYMLPPFRTLHALPCHTRMSRASPSRPLLRLAGAVSSTNLCKAGRAGTNSTVTDFIR